MVVYDFVAAAIVVVFLVRGARRGLVREAVEVSVLIVGVVVAFRVSPVVGSIISGMANIPYETARIIAGIVMFFVLVVGGAVVARAISGAMKIVPGASVLKRFGGAATAERPPTWISRSGGRCLLRHCGGTPQGDRGGPQGVRRAGAE